MSGRFLKSSCDHCGDNIEFPEENLGDSVNCPHCGAQISLNIKVRALMTDRPERDFRWLKKSLLVVALALVGAFVIGLIIWIDHNEFLEKEFNGLGGLTGFFVGMAAVAFAVVLALLWILFPVFVYYELRAIRNNTADAAESLRSISLISASPSATTSDAASELSRHPSPVSSR